MHFLKYIRYNKLHTKKGMTLVELMVVLAIFLIVASLTIFDYGKFRSNVSLQNLGDDVALSIRRAQNYAIGVHSSQTAVFNTGYGIHFSTVTPNPADARGGSNKTFLLFNDLNNNDFYEYPAGSSSTLCGQSTLASGDECIDMLSITSNDAIYQICPGGVGAGLCTTTGYTDITFLRPNPDAFICTGTIAGGVESLCAVTPSGIVDVVIKNIQSGNLKTISVTTVGQISIK